MPSSAAPADVLRSLAEAMRHLGARWYLFGAQAVLFWGRPRLTADIDVTVWLDREDPERLVAELARAGFSLRALTADFAAKTRVFPFLHEPSRWPVDLVLAGPGLEERFMARAVHVSIGDGVTVPIISPEDLIVTKTLAGRPKDIQDIRGVLLERRGQLDVVLIRETLGLLEEALGVSDLLPAFEGELARLKPPG